jgi:hypothetical protein
MNVGIPFEARDEENLRNYRDTSRKVWEEISVSKLMEGSHYDLYTVVALRGPLTVDEATEILRTEYKSELSRNEVAKRMSNLHYNYKVIREIGEVVCSVSGKKILTYDSNLQQPVAQKKKLTKNKKIEQLAVLCQHSIELLKECGQESDIQIIENELLKLVGK